MDKSNTEELKTCLLYAKYDGMKKFKAINISSLEFVDNLIYASMMQDSECNKKALQEIADENKNISLVLQLRYRGRVVFATND